MQLLDYGQGLLEDVLSYCFWRF